MKIYNIRHLCGTYQTSSASGAGVRRGTCQLLAWNERACFPPPPHIRGLQVGERVGVVLVKRLPWRVHPNHGGQLHGILHHRRHADGALCKNTSQRRQKRVVCRTNRRYFHRNERKDNAFSSKLGVKWIPLSSVSRIHYHLNSMADQAQFCDTARVPVIISNPQLQLAIALFRVTQAPTKHYRRLAERCFQIHLIVNHPVSHINQVQNIYKRWRTKKTGWSLRS